VLRFSDARNFGRTLTGLCLIGGTLVLLVGSIVSPNTMHDNKTKELAAVAAHKGSFLASALLLFLGGLLLIPAAVGLVKLFRGPRGVTLGQVASGLLVYGAATLLVFYTFTIIEYEMVNQKGLNTPALAQYLHKANNTASGTPIFILFIVGVVIAQILLAIAIWRTRILPRWVPAVLLAAGVLSFSQAKAATIVSGVLSLVAFGMLGRHVLTMSDDEWDKPLEPAAPAGPEAPVAPAPAPAT
jgi:hypothetical protein